MIFKCKHCNKKYKYRKSYYKHVDSHKKDDNQKLHLEPVNSSNKREIHLKHDDFNNNQESSKDLNLNLNLNQDAIDSLFIKAGLLTPPRQLKNDDINKIDFEKINLNSPKKNKIYNR